MNEVIHKISLSGEFKTCPNCGYKDGFHSAFRQQEDKTLWLFICPSCHAVFDIGATIELENPPGEN